MVIAFKTGMERLDNLLIVAGAGRNVGKTEFVCRLIEKHSSQSDIYGLKVSAIHPDEAIYHGDHSKQRFTANLFEETRYDLDKDTSRMLRAGAKKVYYLQGDDEQIRFGFQEFHSMIPASAPISLRVQQPVEVCATRSVDTGKSGHCRIQATGPGDW